MHSEWLVKFKWSLVSDLEKQFVDIFIFGPLWPLVDVTTQKLTQKMIVEQKYG